MDLKKELRKRELRQVRVAQALGIHPSRFSGICNGWLRPSPEQRSRIASFLGVTSEDLFPKPKEPGE